MNIENNIGKGVEIKGEKRKMVKFYVYTVDGEIADIWATSIKDARREADRIWAEKGKIDYEKLPERQKFLASQKDNLIISAKLQDSSGFGESAVADTKEWEHLIWGEGGFIHDDGSVELAPDKDR